MFQNLGKVWLIVFRAVCQASDINPLCLLASISHSKRLICLGKIKGKKKERGKKTISVTQVKLIESRASRRCGSVYPSVWQWFLPGLWPIGSILLFFSRFPLPALCTPKCWIPLHIPCCDWDSSELHPSGWKWKPQHAHFCCVSSPLAVCALRNCGKSLVTNWSCRGNKPGWGTAPSCSFGERCSRDGQKPAWPCLQRTWALLPWS